MKRGDARERILETASALFCRHGINNVGVDRVIARSGVAKMTLYHHFKSKDELVLAFLDRVYGEWSGWLAARVSKIAREPRARLLAVFDALEEWFKTPAFRGCPFINTAAEVRDPKHPAHRSARAFKERLREYLEGLARDAGLAEPEALADKLLLLADGAIVRAAMDDDPRAAKTAQAVAAALLRREKEA